MKQFDELLRESVQTHGHLCPGQVIGVRMAMIGCRLVGVDDPKSMKMKKKLMVFVEIDRCATDAIESVTGCKLGKRTLKFKDFGINAATFLNLETRQAYRIVSTEASRSLVDSYAPNIDNKQEQQIQGYKQMPDDLLFDIQPVAVDLHECDMPGPPRRHAVCHRCGQVVRDGKEKIQDNVLLCGPCSAETYFHPLSV